MVFGRGDGSNRGKHSKARLIALAFVAALILGAMFINSGLSRDAVYQGQANANTREYAAYTDQQIRQSCVRLIGDEKANCIAKYRQESRNNERNEQDLVAQRKSANWAYIMGAAAVVGMVLSVIGVVLVWTTFDETRRANLLSKDMQRGRIDIEFESGFGAESGVAIIKITAHNIGGSYVLNCRASVHDAGQIPETFVPEFLDGAWHTIAGGAEATLATYSGHEFRTGPYYLFGIVQYDCIFGDSHQTYFCSRIAPNRKALDHNSSGLVRAIPCKPADWPKDT
jgi:hypothetical protein